MNPMHAIQDKEYNDITTHWPSAMYHKHAIWDKKYNDVTYHDNDQVDVGRETVHVHADVGMTTQMYPGLIWWTWNTQL